MLAYDMREAIDEALEKTPEAQTSRYKHQVLLEKLFSRNQLLPRIRREFRECEGADFIQHMIDNEIPEDFGLDLLAQMALHKRASLPTLVGLLRHHFGDSQMTADMIYRACACDLVDWDTNLRIFIVRFTISADVQQELDRFQYPLPMVVRPRYLRTNKETGYLTSSGSVILKNNHHEDDVCLDHLNRMNRVRLSVDQDTALMIKNQWKNLDRRKPGETQAEFDKRKKAFQKYDTHAKAVIDLLIQEGNEFYLTHRYDKRGRTYCQGYYVDYQGNAWNKATIELADKEYVE